MFKDFSVSDMNASCLALPGVLTAAWVEAGMIARSDAGKGIMLSIELLEERPPRVGGQVHFAETGSLV